MSACTTDNIPRETLKSTDFKQHKNAPKNNCNLIVNPPPPASGCFWVSPNNENSPQEPEYNCGMLLECAPPISPNWAQ